MTNRLLSLLLLALSGGAFAQQVRVAPVYLGQPLTAANASFKVYVARSVDGSGDELNPGLLTRTYSGPAGVTDGYYIRRSRDRDTGPAFFGTTLQYPPTGILDWAPDISSHYGVLRGALRIDGNIPGGGTTTVVANQLMRYGEEVTATVDAAGNFRLLLEAATYIFDVRYNNNQVGSFTLSVVAGQEVDANTISMPSSNPNGLFRITPQYLGQPISNYNAAFGIDYWLDFDDQRNPFGPGRLTITDSRRPGAYIVSLRADIPTS